MIDVHVLVRPDNPHWGACYNSLKDQPINLHILDWEPGHIGRGRIRGYSQGTSEWVSYIDDDDIALPDAFDYVNRKLAEHPSVVTLAFNFQLISQDGAFLPVKPPDAQKEQSVPYQELPADYPTHLFNIHPRHIPSDVGITVYKREVLKPFLPLYQDYPRGGDFHVAVRFFGAKAHCKFLGGYNKRPISLWRRRNVVARA